MCCQRAHLQPHRDYPCVTWAALQNDNPLWISRRITVIPLTFLSIICIKIITRRSLTHCRGRLRFIPTAVFCNQARDRDSYVVWYGLENMWVRRMKFRVHANFDIELRGSQLPETDEESDGSSLSCSPKKNLFSLQGANRIFLSVVVSMMQMLLLNKKWV